mgnify:CR=1 FL=1
MVSYLINLKKKITIILAMPHLKMVGEVVVVLVALEVLAVQTFQIYLKIFLVTLVVVEEAQKGALITEGLI